MAVKRSMSVRSCPILDEDTEPPAAAFFSNDRRDPRWVLNTRTHAYGWSGPWGYVIARVTNSLDYRPGFLLTRRQVNELIEGGWTVSVLSRG